MNQEVKSAAAISPRHDVTNKKKSLTHAYNTEHLALATC